MNDPLASIVICTHNRAFLLRDCLEALAGQAADVGQFEAIVVDNASTDETPDVVRRYAKVLPTLRYIYEPVVGLSHARNRAMEEASSPWIAYLDDDAAVLEGYPQRLKVLVGDAKYDCVAGIFLPWYRDGRLPWFLDRYASNDGIAGDYGELPVDAYASGGICLFRLDALRSVGGFSTDLGMAGRRMAYGEETRVQVLMRARGCRIGIDPQWRVRHHVPLGKQDMVWMLRSAFARGRDSWFAFDKKATMLAMINVSRKLVTRPVAGLGRSLREWRNWRSWRNPALDILEPIALTLGQLAGGLQGRRYGG